MKTILYPVLVLLIVLSACSPAPTSPAAIQSSPIPTRTEDGCTITPHEYLAQEIPIPAAVMVNNAGRLSLFWRDGTPIGEWQTGSPATGGGNHVTGVVNIGAALPPLVFFASDEQGVNHLQINRDGQISSLAEFPNTVTVTGLIGVPGRSHFVYSTLEPSANGGVLHSTVFLADTEPSFDTEAILDEDSTESRYIQPVAIHRGMNGKPDGLWYTYNLWGIGGDLFTNQRSGLYFRDLSAEKSLEFLGMDCTFSDLSIGQTTAAWTSPGGIHMTDLHSGTTVSFPLLASSERGAAHGLIVPGDGVMVWLEGRGWMYDGSLLTTLRIGTSMGNVYAEYPTSAFVSVSGLEGAINIVPLGWVDHEVLLLGVYSAYAHQGALVKLNINTGELAFLANGIFAGSAYP
jgi:hypothetical protein